MKGLKLVAMSVAIMVAMSGCAYTRITATPGGGWTMIRETLLWKTEGEIDIGTNGMVSAKGSSGDDSDTVKAAVGAAVSAAVQAVKP